MIHKIMFLKFHQDITGRNSIYYEFYALLSEFPYLGQRGKKVNQRRQKPHQHKTLTLEESCQIQELVRGKRQLPNRVKKIRWQQCSGKTVYATIL